MVLYRLHLDAEAELINNWSAENLLLSMRIFVVDTLAEEVSAG